MSVDTVDRINAYFKANIEDIFGYYTVYVNNNDGLELSSTGTSIELLIEEEDDVLSNTGGQHDEDGTITASIFVETGQNEKLTEVIGDQIKVIFRAPIKLLPASPGDGIIYFEGIGSNFIGDVSRKVISRSTSARTFRRRNIFIEYSKTCVNP